MVVCEEWEIPLFVIGTENIRLIYRKEARH